MGKGLYPQLLNLRRSELARAIKVFNECDMSAVLKLLLDNMREESNAVLKQSNEAVILYRSQGALGAVESFLDFLQDLYEVYKGSQALKALEKYGITINDEEDEDASPEISK